MKRYFKINLFVGALMLSGHAAWACICLDPFSKIDSLADLEAYDFIAHVFITGDKDISKPSDQDFGTKGLLTFKIIELFKGAPINEMIEYAKNSSCHIGAYSGEEWILFGKTIDGKMSIVPCDRNKRYKTPGGLRDWKYDRGFYELRQLKKVFNHPSEKFEHIKRQEFYKNGRLEIEEQYVGGKLNGARKIWYPDGTLFCKQFYINDTLDGKSEWFYPSGQISYEDYYIMGKPCNVSRIYYEQTPGKKRKRNLVADKIQTHHETVFDAYGRKIISRTYTQSGKIYSETTFEPDRKFRTVVYYHENGVISSIMYALDGKNYGHYQTYDKNGFPNGGWDYDENGTAIKQ